MGVILKKLKRAVKYGLLFLLALYLGVCLHMRISEREPSGGPGGCLLYYAVNVDGMKGLGHSILLLIDEEGAGTVLSFNGMQGNLGEALAGKAGVGKMSVGALDSEETAEFLQTGNLDLEEDQLKDNYDVALYRYITLEEWKIIMDRAAWYIETGDQYEELYREYVLAATEEERSGYELQMERMGQDASLPLYQLYQNNCDHVARLLAASVDQEMEAYGRVALHMTPNGNLKAFARRGADWGVVLLGEYSVKERILEFFMIF